MTGRGALAEAGEAQSADAKALGNELRDCQVELSNQGTSLSAARAERDRAAAARDTLGQELRMVRALLEMI